MQFASLQGIVDNADCERVNSRGFCLAQKAKLLNQQPRIRTMRTVRAMRAMRTVNVFDLRRRNHEHCECYVTI